MEWAERHSQCVTAVDYPKVEQLCHAAKDSTSVEPRTPLQVSTVIIYLPEISFNTHASLPSKWYDLPHTRNPSLPAPNIACKIRSLFSLREFEMLVNATNRF